MAIRVVEDSGIIDVVIIELRKIRKAQIQIGIFGKDGGKILMIAVVNEFGVEIKVTDKMRGYLGATGLHLKKDTEFIKIPERSFIRGAYEGNKKDYNKMITRDLKRVVAGKMSADQMLNKLGVYAVGKTREYLTNLDEPQNHPYTLENKSPKTNPLIDSGDLRRKITFKVVHG